MRSNVAELTVAFREAQWIVHLAHTRHKAVRGRPCRFHHFDGPGRSDHVVQLVLGLLKHGLCLRSREAKWQKVREVAEGTKLANAGGMAPLKYCVPCCRVNSNEVHAKRGDVATRSRLQRLVQRTPA